MNAVSWPANASGAEAGSRATWGRRLLDGLLRGLSGPALTEAVLAHRPEPLVALPATPQKGASA